MVPEEKLLRLIRGKKIQKPREEKKQESAAVALSYGNDVFRGAITRITVFFTFWSGIRILQVLCALAFIFTLVNFLYPVFFLKNIAVLSHIKGTHEGLYPVVNTSF
ncbi:MAG: hypothetical protein PHE58_02630, partial [Candidatus Omnitrophica bacterium]|nr:hypothetical protein [Candidatus Omnitrophota bacterium]